MSAGIIIFLIFVAILIFLMISLCITAIVQAHNSHRTFQEEIRDDLRDIFS